MTIGQLNEKRHNKKVIKMKDKKLTLKALENVIGGCNNLEFFPVKVPATKVPIIVKIPPEMLFNDEHFRQPDGTYNYGYRKPPKPKITTFAFK